MKKVFSLLLLCLSMAAIAAKPVKSKDGNSESYFTTEYYYAFIEATKQMMLGNLKGSVALYNECIKANPYSSASYYQLSIIFTRVGDYQRARYHAQKAVEISRKNIWYNYQLANIYASNNQADSTLAIFEAMQKEFPEKREVTTGLVNMYIRTQNYTKALETIERAEKNFGLGENLALAKYEVFNKTNRAKEAEKILTDLVTANPEEVRYLGMLGEHYIDQEMKDQGREIFLQILTIDPSNVFAELALGDYYHSVQKYDTMYLYYAPAFSSGDLDLNTKVSSMINVLNDSILISEHNYYVKQLIGSIDSVHPDESVVYTLWADFYLRLDSQHLASQYLDSLLAKDSRSYFIWEQYLVTLSRLENYEAVAEQAQLAIDLFPDKVFLYFVQGMAWFNLKKYNEAIVSLSKGVTLKSDRPELLVNMYSFLAESYRHTGETDKSDQAFESALDIEPDNNMILNNYSYYLSIRGENLAKAKKMSAKTISTEPENATYLDTYGWVMFAMKKYDEAYKYIKKAIENGSDQNEEVLEHFADILVVKGRYKEALEYYEKAQGLSNNKEKYTQKIEAVKEKIK